MGAIKLANDATRSFLARIIRNEFDKYPNTWQKQMRDEIIRETEKIEGLEDLITELKTDNE